MDIQGNIIDLHQGRIYFGKIEWENGIITAIEPLEGSSETYILPGFVDAHVHIESSMLTPTEFGRMAVVHGTVATVSDPHEIANVLGMDGVLFFLKNAEKTPFKACFGAPSCVPATAFETAGAALNADEVRELLLRPDIYYLSEMMNFPGVLYQQPEVMAKLAAAREIGKPIDGHAPGLRGKDAAAYFAAGISTDHECFTEAEGREKAELGVKILIREGSAAKNFEALIPLLSDFPAQIMFCSDDKHPDELVLGHINQLVARALAKGHDFFDVLRAACLHPVEHYRLPVGQLRVGDAADFIVTTDIKDFYIKKTYINGALVAENGQTTLPYIPEAALNNFHCLPKDPSEFRVAAKSPWIRVIEAYEGQLVTGCLKRRAKEAKKQWFPTPNATF